MRKRAEENPQELVGTMLLCADSDQFAESRALWLEIINSSAIPSSDAVLRLMDAYSRAGEFDELSRVVRESAARDYPFTAELYSAAVSFFGRAGQLQMMEAALQEMILKGFKVNSFTGNAFLENYSKCGSLSEMGRAYKRLKESGILIEKETIRSVVAAYIAERKFYLMGEFLRDVGLRRRNAGNLLWNLLLLSYAANFKMKSLQKEFLRMSAAGFFPDLTTFNIRAMAFSRMGMVWDLHLSLEHMAHLGVAPDLVTCGCVVDLYLERGLGRNLSFVLGKMDLIAAPGVRTDPLVFEVFGKGAFLASAEVFMESSDIRGRTWSYESLIAMYLKKQYRSNQVIWNY